MVSRKLAKIMGIFVTWGSGPLLRMARVLVPIGRLLMLILNVSLLVDIIYSETTNRNCDNMNI